MRIQHGQNKDAVSFTATHPGAKLEPRSIDGNADPQVDSEKP